MKITPDTNLFLRTFLKDSPAQAELALDVLMRASMIAVPIVVLCEVVWVLRGLRKRPEEIADAIEGIITRDNCVTDRAAARAGLAMLRAGGDFADGAIAEAGAALGGSLFVSFDTRAVALRTASGGRAATPDAVPLQP